MLDFLALDALVSGVLASDNATKQELGRKFAVYLGLLPGPRGADGGVDGFGEWNGRRIYFQSKLERELLNASRAAEFYGNLVLYQANVGILLSGQGYTLGFRDRLELDPNLYQTFKVHLLSLVDLFGQTLAWEAAAQDLPSLVTLASSVGQIFDAGDRCDGE